MPDPDRLPKVDHLPPPSTGTTTVHGLSYGPTGKISNQSAAALARPYTAEAISTLVEIMRDPESPVEQRRGAANDILSRSWGKPKETVELLESDGQVATRAALAGLTGSDLRDLLAALRSAPAPTEPTTIDVTPGRARALPDRSSGGSNLDRTPEGAGGPPAGGETKPPPPADASGGGEGAEGV